MMKKTQAKDAFRMIRKNFVSYLAVAIVTMIGCGVYFGAFFFADALADAGQRYFAQTNFEDLDIVAATGLSEDEIAQIASYDGISDAEGTYQIQNATVSYGGEDYQATVVGATDRVGKTMLIEGAMPSTEGQCALPADAMKDIGAGIGDTITISLPDIAEGLLKTDSFVVTAKVSHPEDYRTGSNDYVILPKEAFDLDTADGNFTMVRIKAEVPEDLKILSPAYFESVSPIKTSLEEKLAVLGKDQFVERKKRAEDTLAEKEEEAQTKFGEAQATIDEKEQELREAEAQVKEGEAQIADAEIQLAEAKSALNSRSATISSIESILHMPIPGVSGKVSSGRKQIAEKEALLEEKKAELAEAKAQVEEGRKQLEEGKAELAEKKAEANGQIEDAKKKIDQIKEGVFVVLTRKEKESYVALEQIVTILKRLASIFVVIFMGIGVIVVLSTITILIDNQKKLIGAMKAFGFRNREIIMKYAVFGVSAVFFGMLLSIGLAFLLQRIISAALGGIFVAEPGRFSFRLPVFLMLLVVELALAAVVAVIATYLNAVRSSAVDLMNGVTKQAGISFIAKNKKGKSLYSRLIFRNMLKDLARVICSVIIIAGSCLMIGVGFTMNDAFQKMTEKSVEEVTHYDIEVSLPDGTDEEEIGELKEMLIDEGLEFAGMCAKQTRLLHGNKEEYATVITGDSTLFGDYLILSKAGSGEALVPDAMEVYVPIRMTEGFGIEPGDSLIVYDGEMKPHVYTVNRTYQNYIGRNIYLSKDIFDEIFGEGIQDNLFLVRIGDRDPDEVAAAIQKAFPKATAQRTDTLPASVAGFWNRVFHALIVVMTGLSIIMSIFVLLNLVNIFVSRRKNELIIMAVNGFSYRQRIGYLLRETVATTILGLVIGMVGGWALTDYLVRIIEPTDAMFDRSIQPVAWVVACVIETVFALLINFFAFRRVKQYQMTDLTR